MKTFLEDYLTEMKALGRSEDTIDSVRYTMQKLNKFKPINKITKKDLVEYFLGFKGADQTKRLHMGQIKKFYKYCKKDDIVEWIRLPKIKEKRLEILTINHINNLIDATNDMYWQTYIVFAFEVGARFAEIQSLRWKDIVDNYSVAEILTEKTSAGLRRIPLKMSTSYLMNLKIQTNATENDIIFPLSECRVLTVLKEISKNAGMKIKIYPHLFRHSCATRLVEEGMQEFKLRYWMGWTATSPMPARYIHLRSDILIDDKKPKPIETVKPVKSAVMELQSTNQNLMKGISDQKEYFEKQIEDLKKQMIHLYINLKNDVKPEDITGVKL